MHLYHSSRVNTCVNKISKPDYDDLVREVQAFLTGKNHALQTMLSNKMEQFSNELNYEKAAELKKKIDLRKENQEKISELESLLKLAVEKEDYTKAAELKKEINLLS